MINLIKTSECDWMRNDYCSNVIIGGITYPTLEHAYQAAKTTDRSVKEEIAAVFTAQAARKLGRKIKLDADDWELKRWDVMETLLLKKFLSNDIIKDRLIKTNDADIVADYNDNYWGACDDGSGDNTLGLILERVRTQLQIMEGYTFTPTTDAVEVTVPTLEEALENSDEILRGNVQELFNRVKNLIEKVDSLVSSVNDSDFSDSDGSLYDCENANGYCEEVIERIETLLKTPDCEEEEESDDDTWND